MAGREQAGDAKKNHRYTSPRDITNFKRISLLIDEEVKAFNLIYDSINTLNKRISDLEKSEDEADKKEADKLKVVKQERENDYNKYRESIQGGGIAENVLKKFNENQLSPDNGGISVIEEPKQAGIKIPAEESELPKQPAVNESVQIMIVKRFMHNEIKNSFGKKNLNYFTEIANSRV